MSENSSRSQSPRFALSPRVVLPPTRGSSPRSGSEDNRTTPHTNNNVNHTALFPVKKMSMQDAREALLLYGLGKSPTGSMAVTSPEDGLGLNTSSPFMNSVQRPSDAGSEGDTGVHQSNYILPCSLAPPSRGPTPPLTPGGPVRRYNFHSAVFPPEEKQNSGKSPLWRAPKLDERGSKNNSLSSDKIVPNHSYMPLSLFPNSNRDNTDEL
ncbi:hypothetical protein, conserved [Angomonas deanei]|uniref:Uncharacterized protein n=1 Tax=Angomonas deanei TaxID=59799 RepID=A0A7G2C2E3_9TRYP|nr:hypothetical protein, conserved [Angomonas deanei]